MQTNQCSKVNLFSLTQHTEQATLLMHSLLHSPIISHYQLIHILSGANQ